MKPTRALVGVLAVALLLAWVLSSAPASSAPKTALERARADAAELAYKEALSSFQSGGGDVDAVARWSVRWLFAEAAISGDRSAETKKHQARMYTLQSKAAQLVTTGALPKAAQHQCDYFAAEADLWAQGTETPTSR